MQVELWSDVVCPWCYIGRRRLEKALTRVGKRDSVEVILRSYELDPNAPRESSISTSEHLESKYGMTADQVRQAQLRVSAIAAAEGLEYHLERTRPTNTLDAHRLLQLASIRRLRPVVEERFEHAYFTEGASLGDPETLLRLATEAGLSDSDVRRVLAGQAFTLQVRADERDAAALGASGVPFFVFDRKEVISGAQPTEVILRALGAEPKTS